MSLTTVLQDIADDRKAQVERMLATAPEIQIFEDKLPIWQAVQASDEHMKSLGPFTEFAVRWARLIQLNLNQGMPFDKAAQHALCDADYDHISGATLQMATTSLGMAWVHGNALTDWFNGEYSSLRTYLRGLYVKGVLFFGALTVPLRTRTA